MSLNFSSRYLMCMCVFGCWTQFSVLELVDAAIPAKHLDPIKQTIVQVEGVKVSSVKFL